MDTTQPEPVRSVAHLRQLIRSGRRRFSILLAGGLVGSRKTIRETTDGRFRVVNMIDDTTQTLTGGELFTDSNIGEAIRKGCLIAN